MSRGVHLIIDCQGLPFELCIDDKKLFDVLTQAASENGANIISTSRYRFGHNSPSGCTVFLMLDESHISLHTYADDGQMAIDIFTCGKKIDGKKIFETVKNKLRIKNFILKEIGRF
jgi:S-adenosylmethionine decarboxylase